MATLEERVQSLEQEHSELKKTIELQTMAIGGLVNKTTLERMNEKYDKLFKALIAHDNFTNGQLSELRNQCTELDGKIVGLQSETRQHFAQVDTTLQEHTTMLQEQKGLLTAILARLPEHS
jgi:peptidoglycan hydrolase CwlO-like protein